MSDLISKLWSEGTAANATTGFKNHPIGTFAGVVTGIEEKEHDGRRLYEVWVETDQGKTKHTIWDLDQADLEKLGEVEFVEQVNRRKRLVVDLGQPDPADYDGWLVALGQCVGAPCQVVVQPNKKRPGEVVVWLNAPDQAGPAGLPAQAHADTTARTQAAGRPAAGAAAKPPQAAPAAAARPGSRPGAPGGRAPGY